MIQWMTVSQKKTKFPVLKMKVSKKKKHSSPEILKVHTNFWNRGHDIANKGWLGVLRASLSSETWVFSKVSISKIRGVPVESETYDDANQFHTWKQHPGTLSPIIMGNVAV